ncbi:kinase-like protein [Auricularia subglabra TFB-10046 SS5]|nr:kinase-like protein [Auricularia subglabra TFB-10046 SS5]
MLAVMSPALSRHSSNPMEDHHAHAYYAQESDDPLASYVVPGSVSDNSAARRKQRLPRYEDDEDDDDGLIIVGDDDDELLLGATTAATTLDDEGQEDEDEDMLDDEDTQRRQPEDQEAEGEEDELGEVDGEDEDEEMDYDDDDDDDDNDNEEPSTDEETTIQLREPEERTEIQDEFRELLAAVPRLAREYVLLDRLGTGTFSTVYKARDLLQNRYDNTLWKTNEKESLVAIKRINVTSSPERIRNEIIILAQVAGCRHVSQLITAFREKDQVVAIMPYCRNEDFRPGSLPWPSGSRPFGPAGNDPRAPNFYNNLPIDGVQAYFRCLFRALRDIHARRIVHRDVKPANFLFDPRTYEGTLCDFGLAMHIEPPGADNGCNHSSPTPAHPHGGFVPITDEWTHQLRAARRDARTRKTWPSERVGVPDQDNRPISKANRAGTRGFRPPEVLLKCNDQSGAVDVWAAGTMMLFFLTGRFPVYTAGDDVEALMELATILGFKRMEKAAILHNRTFITNVPSVTDEGITWRDFVLKLHPRLLERADEEDDAAHDARCAVIEDALDLVEMCLEPEAPRRITARDALLHPFLREEDTDGDDDDRCVHPPGEGACARMHSRDDITGDWSVLLVGGDVRQLAVGEGLCVGRGPCALHAGPEYSWEPYVGPWERESEDDE